MATRLRDFFRTLSPAFIIWVLLLLAGIGVGLYSGGMVFWKGLVITNLTDLVPWGLWITADVTSIALAGGAFFLSALVYIIGVKSFRPIARLAVFIGIMGYTAAMCTLALDIGRPDRFWHAVIYWNVHSMLWEVTMCILLYFSVLVLEGFPLVVTHPFFERWPGVRRTAEMVHSFAPVLAYMGLGFSMLHQSSLGGTFGVLIARPIWFSPTLPLIFIISAMAAGPALAVAVAIVTRWLRGTEVVPENVLFNVAKVIGGVMLVYLYIRFWDIYAGTYGYVPLRSEATAALTGGTYAMNFWGWEVALGGIIPALLVLWAAAKRNRVGLFIGCGMIVVGLAMHRWHTTLIGFLTPLSVEPAITYPVIPTYTPSFYEWGAVAGILSAVLLALTLGLRYLPAFAEGYDEHAAHAHTAAPVPQPAAGD